MLTPARAASLPIPMESMSCSLRIGRHPKVWTLLQSQGAVADCNAMSERPAVVHRQSLLRSRDSHARVTFVELFFDLVFVFAVTQLSHTLLEHLTITGA